MKYRLLAIDPANGSIEPGREKDIPTDEHPLAYVAKRLQFVGGIIAAMILDGEKMVSMVTFWSGDKWVVFDHTTSDSNRMTLEEMTKKGGEGEG